MSSLKYWIWLSSLDGIGVRTANNLLDAFGTPENVYFATDKDYFGIQGITKAAINCLANKDLSKANKILADCVQIGCRTITLQDSEYPDRLRNIYDPPLILYIKGIMPDIDSLPVVGIVGTRKCTPYGINVAETIAYKLSECGIVVSTGLAAGIDTAAANGALGGGFPVIGVIGTGPDIVFPRQNRKLFSDVASQGVIISEYPPGTPGMQHHFPARNRIISGLSVGVAVIESPERSGALITASRALEQGRDVFALPGNIDAPCCVGSNKLLREGAIPFTSAEDIIDEYIDLFPDKIRLKTDADFADITAKSSRNTVKSKQISEEINNKVIDISEAVDYIDFDKFISQLDGDGKTVVEIIGFRTVHVDEIITKSNLEAKEVLTALTMLEIDGYVKNSSGKYYSIIV